MPPVSERRVERARHRRTLSLTELTDRSSDAQQPAMSEGQGGSPFPTSLTCIVGARRRVGRVTGRRYCSSRPVATQALRAIVSSPTSGAR